MRWTRAPPPRAAAAERPAAPAAAPAAAATAATASEHACEHATSAAAASTATRAAAAAAAASAGSARVWSLLLRGQSALGCSLESGETSCFPLLLILLCAQGFPLTFERRRRRLLDSSVRACVRACV